MGIEFRVEGKDRDTVAEELALYVKTMFGVEASIRKQVPLPVSEGGVRERGLAETAVLVVHLAIIAHTAYEKYVQQPHEKAVGKWRELVFFAKEKLPTLIHAVIGDEASLLHKSEPERLYQLTRKTLDSATVTTE